MKSKLILELFCLTNIFRRTLGYQELHDLPDRTTVMLVSRVNERVHEVRFALKINSPTSSAVSLYNEVDHNGVPSITSLHERDFDTDRTGQWYEIYMCNSEPCNLAFSYQA